MEKLIGKCKRMALIYIMGKVTTLVANIATTLNDISQGFDEVMRYIVFSLYLF